MQGPAEAKEEPTSEGDPEQAAEAWGEWEPEVS